MLVIRNFKVRSVICSWDLLRDDLSICKVDMHNYTEKQRL